MVITMKLVLSNSLYYCSMSHSIKQRIKGKLKSSRNLLCQKSKRRRIANNQVTGNPQQFNPEILKKKNLKFCFTMGPNILKKIWEEPYYICHRRFCWCSSVHYFSTENYNNFKMNFMPAATFNNKLYICLTCNKSVSKGKIPCQAVCNKLEVEVTPKVLQNLRRPEKFLISRKIMFKKIAIMHGKGEFL